jgi:ABC-type transport system involved in multi-copper enzyme maturation permease subunit
VKETRQALKSRQFLITFSVVLCAALGWTVIGSLSMMPQIYTAPSAPRMLIGYYIVLAVPMMLVVPLAAYRSLEGEIDDGTFELLSITTLSPWQIVLGKMASAMLQMLLYFVALFPCVAYAYTLRGVDLPTTLSLLGALILVGSFLTIVALFFAPLAQSRSGRIVTLLFTMVILLAAQFALGSSVINVIWVGNPMRVSESFYVGLFLTAIILAGGHLLLTATAAQLTPVSENRSTTIRLSLLVFTAVMVGIAIFMGGRRQYFPGWTVVVGGQHDGGGTRKHDAANPTRIARQFLEPCFVDLPDSRANDGAHFYVRSRMCLGGDVLLLGRNCRS